MKFIAMLRKRPNEKACCQGWLMNSNYANRNAGKVAQ